MSYCKKCGAYIPIGETACPACGYDPEAEAKAAQEAEERAKREAAKKAQQERSWAEQERRREAQERARREAEERARREAEERARQQSRGGAASQTRSAPGQQGEGWVPPWSQTQTGGSRRTNADPYADMQRRARDSVENQRLSVLSYLGILLFIPLALRKDDPFARFHSNQGLVLFLASAIMNLLFMDGVLGVFAAGFELYCIVKGIQNVLKGKMEPLPLIGSIRLIK